MQLLPVFLSLLTASIASASPVEANDTQNCSSMLRAEIVTNSPPVARPASEVVCADACLSDADIEDARTYARDIRGFGTCDIQFGGWGNIRCKNSVTVNAMFHGFS
jgi:hypothetical protein